MRHNPVVRIERLTQTQRNILLIFTGFALLAAGFIGGVLAEQFKPKPSLITVSIKTPIIERSAPSILPTTTTPFPYKTVGWNPTPEEFKTEVDCLAKNIYFEAKSESTKGRIAVGLVTINRVLSSKFPNTICGVVWQKRKNPRTGKMTAQFSWTLDGKADTPVNPIAWEESKTLAWAMLAENSLHNFADFTKGSTHYHATYVSPYWKDAFTKISQIGAHIFYRDEKTTPLTNTLAVVSDSNTKL